MSQPKQIYIGGWTRFREECGATKKEPFEDFSWMGSPILGTDAVYAPSVRADYEDCRDALARVEGGKEYIKTYKQKEGFNFQDPIGQHIKLHGGHSGSSWACMLWAYQMLLNDWDGWVLQTKERCAYKEYEKRQAQFSVIHWMVRMSQKAEVIQSLLEEHGLGGVTVEEGVAIVKHIYDEFTAKQLQDQKEREANELREIVSGLEFKYKHPIRWFDTHEGSSIGLRRVSQITEPVMAEMTRRHPDYPAHIEFIRDVMPQIRLPNRVGPYTTEAEAFRRGILKRIGEYNCGESWSFLRSLNA
jgi:hypothetical protein